MNMYHICALTSSCTFAIISGKSCRRTSQYWSPVSWCGKTSGPTKQSPIPAHTLMLNCCWCLHVSWWFPSTHWCWLWILMMPSLQKCASSVNSTDETKKWSALHWTKQQQKFSCASGHMLIWTFVLDLVCGNNAQSLSVPFSYTLYSCRTELLWRRPLQFKTEFNTVLPVCRVLWLNC
jgi:hypothetical protein